ncbi:hypothetical protein EVAR_39635_1 [Eumeta japonica]|uniref:Uncharacterized protein n=1 Tax=Eumeta variegata TaxID=151549 RepID=A0A4C1WIT4_EUMVA|nr:hypothetical protein EVAR_39635_1 [Eumeta japonica]
MEENIECVTDEIVVNIAKVVNIATQEQAYKRQQKERHQHLREKSCTIYVYFCTESKFRLGPKLESKPEPGLGSEQHQEHG